MNFPSVFTISASSTQTTCTFVSEYASFFHPASDGATWLTDFSMVTFEYCAQSFFHFSSSPAVVRWVIRPDSVMASGFTESAIVHCQADDAWYGF